MKAELNITTNTEINAIATKSEISQKYKTAISLFSIGEHYASNHSQSSTREDDDSSPPH